MTDTSKWVATLGKYTATNITNTATLSKTVEIARCDATGGSYTLTLPATADWVGKKITVKCVGGSANAVTVSGNGFNIDGTATIVLQDVTREYATFYNNGTTIDIVG